MRKKLQSIAAGHFTDGERKLIFEKEKIRFRVVENENFRGSFTFSSEDGQAFAGFLSCPDKRIRLEQQNFYAASATVFFEFDPQQLTDGAVEEGYFVITSEIGEYTLPYEAEVSRDYAHTSIGWVKTLNDFTNLAKLNWEEAKKLFATRQFLSVFSNDDIANRQLYQALTGRGYSSHTMEEFLIGCGKKERNRFWLEDTRQTFVVAEGTCGDVLHINKTQWGHIHLHLSVDSPLVRLEKTELFASDFEGNNCEVAYTIDPAYMHGGKNYSAITVRDMFHEESMEIYAYSRHFHRHHAPTHVRTRTNAQLMKLYVEYQQGQILHTQWANESLGVIDDGLLSDPEYVWLHLFKAYILIETNRQHMADKVLYEFEKYHQVKKSPMEGFTRFLKTYRSNDAEARAQTVQVLRGLYRQHPSHPVLVWSLLQLDDALHQSPKRRYVFLKKYMTEYGAGPVFYHECLRLVKQNPRLLENRGIFEMQFLTWAQTHGQLCEELCEAVRTLSRSHAGIDKKYLRLMKSCYEIMPDKELLSAICSYQIALSQYDEEALVWYRMAVDRKLRIAGLYEAYIRSWNPAEELPPVILRYFTTGKELPWPQKAKLYAYVLENPERVKRDAEAYDVLIQSFGTQCLKKHYANDDLFTIYRYLKKKLPAGQWEELKENCENVVRITVREPYFTAVCSYDPVRMQMLTVPLHDGVAYLYDSQEDAPILLQDGYGKLFSSNESCEVVQMIDISYPSYAKRQRMEMAKQEEKTEDLIGALNDFADTIAGMSEKIIEAKKQGIFVQPYEEKLLTQMLYTERVSSLHTELFEDLYDGTKNTLLLDAYVSFLSRAYLRGQEDLPKKTAAYLRRAAEEGRVLNDGCRIAWLKYLFTSEGIPASVRKAFQSELTELILSGESYGFYNDLPPDIRRQYLMDDLYFIQVCAPPKKTCHIRCAVSRTDAYGWEEAAQNMELVMEEVLPGLYCCSIPVYPGCEIFYTVQYDGKIQTEEHIELAASFFADPQLAECRRDTYEILHIFDENRYQNIMQAKELITNALTGAFYD